MLTISISEDALRRVKSIAESEGEGAMVRLRQFQTGTPCCRKTVLGLAIDEQTDEDVAIEQHGLTFIAEKDLLDQYGSKFTVSLDDKLMPVVVAG